jgi:hypothetical protein
MREMMLQFVRFTVLSLPLLVTVNVGAATNAIRASASYPPCDITAAIARGGSTAPFQCGVARSENDSPLAVKGLAIAAAGAGASDEAIRKQAAFAQVQAASAKAEAPASGTA